MSCRHHTHVQIKTNLAQILLVNETILQVLINCLWYLTNQRLVTADASSKRADVIPVPEAWDSYQGYNQMKRKRLKEMPIQSSALKSQADALFSLCLKPYAKSTEAFSKLHRDIEGLANCMLRYSQFLEDQLKKQTERQALAQPVRLVGNSCSVQHRDAGC